MSYQASTIATIVNRLNVQYFLPAIQREFVWSPDQIIQLFDSLMRGYPINTFLLWALKPENRKRWDIYRFIDTFHKGKTHNKRVAATAGIPELTLVLDGQQRLTSLLIGLKGSYTFKIKHKRRDDPDAWVEHTLYLDLFKDPEQESEDGELGIRYGFEFKPKAPEDDNEHHWFRVQDILDFDSEDRFEKFKYERRDALSDHVTRGQQQVFERNLDRLYRVIWKNQVISYYIETDQRYDYVLDIFVRANEGGTKLSKSDLLLSMVTLNWSGNAREEIHGFVDRLNNELAGKNDFNKDFVMKTCLVLSDLPVKYKVDYFNKPNLRKIENNWDAIKSAIENAVNLVNWFGIDRDTLTSANALIPLIYYLFKHPRKQLQFSTSAAGVRNASAIRRWLTAALLNGVFGGQSDTLLNDTRKVLQDHAGEPDFPLEALNAEVAKSGRTSAFDEAAMENFLEISYGVRETFLALSLLYDDNSWGSTAFQQDHIFPRSIFAPKRLAKSGLSASKQKRYAELVNRIGNLELLLPHENQVKSDQPFEKWLRTRHRKFRSRHLIPDDPKLLRLDKFEEFVLAREKMIRERLKTVLGFDPPSH